MSVWLSASSRSLPIRQKLEGTRRHSSTITAAVVVTALRSTDAYISVKVGYGYEDMHDKRIYGRNVHMAIMYICMVVDKYFARIRVLYIWPVICLADINKNI